MTPDPKARVRFFTPGEATRSLPLVRRIVHDIREGHRELQALLPRLKRARIRARRSRGRTDEAELAEVRARVARTSERIEACLAELEQVGCVLEDPEGVVDFHALREGRPVLLCWRLGEPEVGHWHFRDEGAEARRELPAGSLAGGSGG